MKSTEHFTHEGALYATAKYINEKYPHIPPSTLRYWGDNDKVTCVVFPDTNKTSTIRYYKIDDFKVLYEKRNSRIERKEDGIEKGSKKPSARRCYAYARVSCEELKSNLAEQVEALRTACPRHILVEETASAYAQVRPRFLHMVADVLKGNVQEIAVVHKDRLFSPFEKMFERVCADKGVQLCVLEQGASPVAKKERKSDLFTLTTEFVQDNSTSDA